MLSANNDDRNQVVTKTVWLLFAVAINAFEFFIPRVPFFPWLKPGFANIITIIWIIEFGAIDALLYSLLRIWIVGFFFGFSFLTMTFAISGGMLSTIAMSLLWKGLGKRGLLGTMGLGVCGALFHNAGQILAVYGLMAANMRLFYQVPVMFVASVVFGGIVGLLAPLFHDALASCRTPESSLHDLANRWRGVVPSLASASLSDYVFSLLLLGGCCAIGFTDSLPTLFASALGATLVAQVRRQTWSLKEFLAPLSSFWVLFAFVACVNLFFSYGTRIERFPFLTHEGVDLTVRQWLRLWTWLEVSLIFPYFNFHSVVLSVLRKLFPGHRATLFAGILGLEYFPAVASDSRAYAKRAMALLFAHPLVFCGRFARKGGLSGIVTSLTNALYGIVLKRMETRA
jgi:heptaprenyl diphosphate synthase